MSLPGRRRVGGAPRRSESGVVVWEGEGSGWEGQVGGVDVCEAAISNVVAGWGGETTRRQAPRRTHPQLTLVTAVAPSVHIAVLSPASLAGHPLLARPAPSPPLPLLPQTAHTQPVPPPSTMPQTPLTPGPSPAAPPTGRCSRFASVSSPPSASGFPSVSPPRLPTPPSPSYSLPPHPALLWSYPSAGIRLWAIPRSPLPRARAHTQSSGSGRWPRLATSRKKS